MGCGSGKSGENPIETLICNSEKKLLYQHCKANEVDLIHRKYSFNGKLNGNQWMNVSRHLNLAENQSAGPVSEQIKSFYHLFKKTDSYILREMLVLGILYSTGSAEAKAKLLFEVFDDHDSKELSKDCFGQMYDILYRVSVKRAKVLVDKPSNHVVSDEELNDYFERLVTGKEKFRASFIRTFAGDGEFVSLVGFLGTMKDPKNTNLIDSSGFRENLKGYCAKDIKNSSKTENNKGDIANESRSKVVEEENMVTIDISQE